MTLMKCPDCGKTVSPRATACPECGCPAQFFVDAESFQNKIEINNGISEELAENKKLVEFHFKQSTIKYPENAAKFAGLFGDYTKLGYEKYKELCDIYKRLGDIDSVANNLANAAQKIIDMQIDIIVRDLYEQGVAVTVEQIKNKYRDKYPLEFQYTMDAFWDKYNEIATHEQQMKRNRQASYANRGRWIGGGFGMKGAVKGAIQAGVLNAGTSLISGMGNAVVATANAGTIDRKKQNLYNDNEVMTETCEGIILCMNGLFLLYTDELEQIGKLGSRINLDFSAANDKYQSIMTYEKDRDKLFTNVIECISMYPASRMFYEAIEMEIEECPSWADFKKFWHLDFLYSSKETAFIKTNAKVDDKQGTLKLVKDLLIFDGSNPTDSKTIPIGAIKSVENRSRDIAIGLKGKFLLLSITTPVNEMWAETIKNAMNGVYNRIDTETVAETAAMKIAALKAKEREAEEYILAHFSPESKAEAVKYYRNNVGVSLFEATNAVDAILKKMMPVVTRIVYPGIEELPNGSFRGNEVVLVYGDDELGYTILTTRQLFEIDIKKKKENCYDIFNMSKMKDTMLGVCISFRYSGSLLEKSVGTQGRHAKEFINKIVEIQKGKL